MKFSILSAEKKNIPILHGRVFICHLHIFGKILKHMLHRLYFKYLHIKVKDISQTKCSISKTKFQVLAFRTNGKLILNIDILKYSAYVNKLK